MSIPAIENAKVLKFYGEKMGREIIARRVLYCVKKMLEDDHYQGVIQFIGRMKAISQACNFDGYWKEKVSEGYCKELRDLNLIAFNNKTDYWGYRRKLTKEPDEGIELIP